MYKHINKSCNRNSHDIAKYCYRYGAGQQNDSLPNRSVMQIRHSDTQSQKGHQQPHSAAGLSHIERRLQVLALINHVYDYTTDCSFQAADKIQQNSRHPGCKMSHRHCKRNIVSPRQRYSKDQKSNRQPRIFNQTPPT